MKTNILMQKENMYQLNTYRKYPLVISKGRGIFVYDIEGKKYLDFYGGHAVASTGHCHPKIVKAIKNQLNKIIFYSNAVYNDSRSQALESLIKISPKGFSKVFFCNSGAEANEAAMRMAKKFTNKNEIIAMKGSFHGRTTGALSATGIEKYRTGDLLANFKFAEFGSIDSVKSLITNDTAAIILEPIQSMAGIRVAKNEFYRELQEICSEKNIILIFDEVQTAFARTGKMFAAQKFESIPDIITLAKGIASGLPMGAVLLKEDIAKTIKYGEQGSTFGGSPLVCAALKSTIDVIKEESLAKNAQIIGDYIKKKFENIDRIKEVRGEGLIIGLEFETDTAKIIEALLQNGIIVSPAEPKNVIRLLPPLIVNKKHVDKFYDSMKTLKN